MLDIIVSCPNVAALLVRFVLRNLIKITFGKKNEQDNISVTLKNSTCTFGNNSLISARIVCVFEDILCHKQRDNNQIRTQLLTEFTGATLFRDCCIILMLTIPSGFFCSSITCDQSQSCT